jgi:Aspartyl protease
MRLISVVPLIGCSLLAVACANLHPEQPRMLMREVAEQCADRVRDIKVKGVTAGGRLSYGCGETGQAYREWFLACYQDHMRQGIQSLIASGHLATPAVVTAQTTIPMTMMGDTVLVPVIINHAQQISLVLDLYATNTVLSPVVLDRLGIAILPNAPRWTVSVSGREPIVVPLARVPSVTLGAFTVEELDVGVSQAVPHVTERVGC